MSKYESFASFLSNLKVNNYESRFEEIEKIIGEKLPPSAYQYDAWWSNNDSHPLMNEILKAGWKKTKVDFNTKEVWFERIQNKSRKEIWTIQELWDFIENKMDMQAT